MVSTRELSTPTTGGVHPLKLFDTPTPSLTEGVKSSYTYPDIGSMLFSAIGGYC